MINRTGPALDQGLFMPKLLFDILKAFTVTNWVIFSTKASEIFTTVMQYQSIQISHRSFSHLSHIPYIFTPIQVRTYAKKGALDSPSNPSWNMETLCSTFPFEEQITYSIKFYSRNGRFVQIQFRDSLSPLSSFRRWKLVTVCLRIK